MFNKLCLKTKLLITICGIALLSFIITISYISAKAYETSRLGAIDLVRETGSRYSGEVKAEMDVFANTARTLAQSLGALQNSSTALRRDQVNQILQNLLRKNKGFWGVWASYEPDAFDGQDSYFKNTPGSDSSGQFMPYFHKTETGSKLDITGAYVESDPSGAWYWTPLKSGKDYLTNPTIYTISSKEVMLVSICIPIKSAGKAIGVAGIDFSMEHFLSIIQKITPYETGYSYLVSSSGMMVAHPDTGTIGKNLKELNFDPDIAQAVNQGKTISVYSKTSHFDGQAYTLSTPFKIGRVEQPWSLIVSVEMKKVVARAISLRNVSILISIFSLSVLFCVVYFITNLIIVSPVNKAVAGLKDIAQGEGDLTMRLSAKTKDEIGDMAYWFNVFMEKLQKIISDISLNSNSVNEAAGGLTTVAGRLYTGAENTSLRSDSVTASLNEMTNNLHTVAASMEESSTNASMVATAAEEMSTTINEIAKNAEKARSVALAAVTQTDSASDRMSKLGSAVIAIGKVTETINDISEQTNLLALNATIESARAGEAGKGFAVVANEIKGLAGQTAEATLDIKNQIQEVQTTTSETVQKISQISEVIQSVNDIVVSIATAVEEQTAATKEIADNIGQAALGIQEVNENVGQSSLAAKQISEDIAQVNQESTGISESSSQVSESSKQMKDMAFELKSIVEKFKI